MEKKLMKQIEGMEEGERDKLRELLKDGKQSDEGRLSWMYKDKVDSEEYLLGRRIDQSALSEPEPANQDTPGALFNEVITRRSEMDMQVKMREDPLYAIRKKEEETRRRLLENPIKMKQLQKTIEQQKTEKKHKDKKKKKKHSKSKSSDDDDDLLRQYLAIVNQKMKNKKHEPSHITDQPPRASARSRSGKHRDHPDHESGYRNSRETEHLSSSSTNDCKRRRSDVDSDKSKRHYSRGNRDGDVIDGRRRHGSDADRTESSDHQNSRTKRHERRQESSEAKKDTSETERRSAQDSGPKEATVSGYGLIMSSRAAAAAAQRCTTEAAVMPASQKSTGDVAKPTHKPPKRKLTDEEMALKRAEMAQNARDRDEQRVENVKRYRVDDERERRRAEKSTDTAASFVRPMMVKHASESSVEERIKRNIYNIQRTSTQLDKNFARH